MIYLSSIFLILFCVHLKILFCRILYLCPDVLAGAYYQYHHKSLECLTFFAAFALLYHSNDIIGSRNILICVSLTNTSASIVNRRLCTVIFRSNELVVCKEEEY